MSFINGNGAENRPLTLNNKFMILILFRMRQKFLCVSRENHQIAIIYFTEILEKLCLPFCKVKDTYLLKITLLDIYLLLRTSGNPILNQKLKYVQFQHVVISKACSKVVTQTKKDKTKNLEDTTGHPRLEVKKGGTKI